MTQDDVRAAYQELYDLLDKAYWAATTIEAKDKIKGVSEVIHDILEELNKGALAKSTSKFAEVKDSVDQVNEKLGTIKDQIDDMIHMVRMANQIAEAIDTAIKVAAFFA